VATSLFCPHCGQSSVRPLPAAAVVKPDEKETVVEPPTEGDSHTSADPVARATGWIRRSLNMGKRILPDAGEAQPEDSKLNQDEATQAMSLFDIEEAEQLDRGKPRRPPAVLRFVLKFESGLAITVGETPGFMGVKPLPEAAEEGTQRICLTDPTDSVAWEHVEFGVQKGVFWVKDLRTVNGTVVEEPGSAALQCIPHDTYPLVRGSRVLMGELAFTLH
jgi:hypothetical protein